MDKLKSCLILISRGREEVTRRPHKSQIVGSNPTRRNMPEGSAPIDASYALSAWIDTKFWHHNPKCCEDDKKTNKGASVPNTHDWQSIRLFGVTERREYGKSGVRMPRSRAAAHVEYAWSNRGLSPNTL